MSATAELEPVAGPAPSRARVWLLRATVMCWAVAAALAVTAPFWAFFISRSENGAGRMRNRVVFDGWGQVSGQYADLIESGFPIYGAALAAWSGLLLVAAGLVVKAHLDGGTESTRHPALVLGLIGSAGLVAYAGVIWLAGFAWTSNRTTFEGRTLAEGALGRGHLLAIAAGCLALVGVGLTLALLRHGAGWQERRPLVRSSLAGLSLVVAALVVVAPFATYFSVEVTSFGDTLARFSTDGWGRFRVSDGLNPSAHEVRFGIAQAVAACLLLLGTALLMARPRWRQIGWVASTLGHVAVIASALGVGVVTYSWITRQDSNDIHNVGHIGLGSWVLWASAAASLGWLTVACWHLLPHSLTRLVVIHQPSARSLEPVEPEAARDLGHDPAVGEGVDSPDPEAGENSEPPPGIRTPSKPPPSSDIVTF